MQEAKPHGTENEDPDSSGSKWSQGTKTVEAGLNAISSLLKIGVIAALVVWAAFNQPFIENWIWGLSGGEILGLKFQRTAIEEATAELRNYVDELNRSKSGERSIDQVLALDAINRASRVAPALINSRVLGSMTILIKIYALKIS